MLKLPAGLTDIHNHDSVIISETDPHGTILRANDHFCDISGYSRQELEGKPHNIIRHPSMPKSFFANYGQPLKREKSLGE